MPEYNMTELLKYRHMELVFTSSISESTATTLYFPDSSGHNCGPFKELTVFLVCTAFAGTSLDCDIEIQDPVSGTWFVHTSFTQLTGTGSEMKALTGNLSRNVRAKVVTVGAGAKTFSIGAIGKIM